MTNKQESLVGSESSFLLFSFIVDCFPSLLEVFQFASPKISSDQKLKQREWRRSSGGVRRPGSDGEPRWSSIILRVLVLQRHYSNQMYTVNEPCLIMNLSHNHPYRPTMRWDAGSIHDGGHVFIPITCCLFQQVNSEST